MRRFILSLLVLASCHYQSSAQNLRREDFQVIDSYVEPAGPMKDLSLGAIVDSITKKCTTELQMSRAIYYWVTHQVDFDCRAYQHQNQNPVSASAALMQREATSEGYANLFKAMCDLVHINCVIVPGVYRHRLQDIGTFDAESRHFWNLIDIDHTKYLVDACLGAGNTDEAVKHFTPKYTDAWWLANRLCFALTHFPDDQEQQLLEIPLGRIDVTQAPLVHAGAIITGVIPVKSLKGVLRGRDDTSVMIKCNPQVPEIIRKVSLSYDHGPQKPAEFTIDEFGMWITIPLGEAGEHRLEMYVNNELVFTFRTEVRKSPKKEKR